MDPEFIRLMSMTKFQLIDEAYITEKESVVEMFMLSAALMDFPTIIYIWDKYRDAFASQPPKFHSAAAEMITAARVILEEEGARESMPDPNLTLASVLGITETASDADVQQKMNSIGGKLLFDDVAPTADGVEDPVLPGNTTVH